MSLPSVWELAARQFEENTPKWASPLDMATALDPRTRRTPALDHINTKLVELLNTPNGRLTVSLAPQEGKSQLCSRRFPLWAHSQNPDLKIAIASYQQGVAKRFGRMVRDDLRAHADQFGNLEVREDLAAAHEWGIKDHDGEVYSVGIEGGLTSKPVDLLIIDDPFKGRTDADSPVMRDKVWSWWTDVAASRFGSDAKVVVIATRWHEDDLIGRLSASSQRWQVVNIPAQADHRPEHGETDLLGRQPGEFMVSARGRSREQWEERKTEAGPKTWASLYQGRPSPEEGGIFPIDWETYHEPLWTVRADGSHMVPGMHRDDQEMVISADLAFRDTKSSDYVVMQVWLRIGQVIYLVDQIRDRLNFTATQDALRALCAKWPEAHAKFIEAKANGDAVINSLQREIPGLIPVEPEGSKVARASAISPFAYSKNIILPDWKLLPSVEDLREEARNFPNAAHDDTIDAMSQAANQLLLRPIQDSGIGDIYEPFEYDEPHIDPVLSMY